MKKLALTADNVVWLALVLATVVTWWLGVVVGNVHPIVFPIIIAIAFVKIRFMGRYFMELRRAPLVLRRAFDAWVFVFGVATVVLSLL